MMPPTNDHERVLSPRECGDALKMTAAFIRGEVKDGRLRARIFTRQSGRSVYRIAPADFEAYVARYWPQHAPRGTKENGENPANTGTA